MQGGSAFNLVQGNLIGTDATGTVERSNGSSGVYLTTGSNNNVIGTNGDGVNDATEGNVFAGAITPSYIVALDSVGTNNNVIAGNAIGTDRTGTLPMGGTVGIEVGVGASNTRIGTNGDGVSDGLERNLIDDVGYGIEVSGATGTVIAGDYIGVAADGLTASPDAHYGVYIDTAATGTIIGGTLPADANLISECGTWGVFIQGAGTSGNLVEGDLIGTDKTGMHALPNAAGVIIDNGASGNTIGGGTTAALNVISGNTNDGVDIWNTGTTGNVVEGNYIGVGADGTTALGNGGHGVYVQSGANGNTIGGLTSTPGTGLGNVIANQNAGSGVLIQSANNNNVLGNVIGLNAAGIAAPNGSGVTVLTGNGNLIGGGLAGSANVISGNANYGIILQGGSAFNLVQGNLIGTDATGTVERSNGSSGVYLTTGSNNNVIGTNGDGVNDATEGNVFAGAITPSYIVALDSVGTNNNVIAGNAIGTDRTGTLPMGGTVGIEVGVGASNTRIGTNGDGVSDGLERNLIDDVGYGIEVSGATGTVIAGNYIGVAADGLTASPIGVDGIQVNQAATGTIIGGTLPADANLISECGTWGVFIQGAGTSGNLVEGDLIGTDKTGMHALPNAAGVIIQGGADRQHDRRADEHARNRDGQPDLGEYPAHRNHHKRYRDVGKYGRRQPHRHEGRRHLTTGQR